MCGLVGAHFRSQLWRCWTEPPSKSFFCMEFKPPYEPNKPIGNQRIASIYWIGCIWEASYWTNCLQEYCKVSECPLNFWKWWSHVWILHWAVQSCLTSVLWINCFFNDYYESSAWQCISGVTRKDILRIVQHAEGIKMVLVARRRHYYQIGCVSVMWY